MEEIRSEYSSLLSAQKAARTLNRNFKGSEAQTFCPKINAPCRPDCYCFIPYKAKVLFDQFIVHTCYCIHKDHQEG